MALMLDEEMDENVTTIKVMVWAAAAATQSTAWSAMVCRA